ncbi:MAG: CCA tRNA nucleotidyltransferase [Nanoarchaeota archaeon]
MKEILSNILLNIKPTKEQEKEVFSRVNAVLKKIRIKNADAILGGSGIKGTWLKNAHDADIFVCFDYKIYKERNNEISGILGKYLKKKFSNVIKIHGSRDYFQLKKERFTFEIIPILKIVKAEQAINITDVSPLHAKWVNKHKNLRDEMRLLKQFCKASEVYGAESYIKGLSGYVCEILTVYYGSFLKVIENASKWKEGTIIDIEKYYTKKNVLAEVNSSKLQSPLIVIDPVQEDRNAAAALSTEKFEILRKKAKEFLKKPSETFFEKKVFLIEKIRDKAKNQNLIILNIEVLKGKHDVIGCKLIKSLEYIKNCLVRHNFEIIEYGWNWDKTATFYFILPKKELSKKIVHPGPPLKAKEHVKIFKNKYKKTYTEKGIIKTLIVRKYTKAIDLVKDAIKDKDITNRLKKIEVV